MPCCLDELFARPDVFNNGFIFRGIERSLIIWAFFLNGSKKQPS